jgi:hypothetical protein
MERIQNLFAYSINSNITSLLKYKSHVKRIEYKKMKNDMYQSNLWPSI